MSNLSDTYQKKTDREHILDAPDTYVGSIEEDDTTNWILSNREAKMVWKSYQWVAGLYKCFDEGLVNARDHFTRLQEKKKKGDKNIIPVTYIDISISKKTGVITMTNDGDGIDIAKHPEYDIWIPEMIFGHLRTSTNYNKKEKKIVGGKNGFGFKLVLIYSLWGRIQTIDHKRGLKYTQKFKNNLSEICKPSIKKCTGTPFTQISFLPDYKRFGMENITNTMFQLFKKRTYDLAAVTNKSVKVSFNGKPIDIRNFESYIDLYIGPKSEMSRVYEKTNIRWEYAVSLSPLDEFTQVSFVNGIYTGKGGKHIDYILNQITRKLIHYIEKKKKIKVKSTTIKEQIMLFLNCVIENPAFDSQTKDYMNTPISKFGSSTTVSDKFIEKIAKLGVMESAISLNLIKENNAAKKTDGKKTRTIHGIPKLIDANYAGTTKSKECTLILCEGDSAKAGIVSGLSREDRDYIGIFPLKGKLLNTKDVGQNKINQNVEITNIKKIIGLETNKKYLSRDDMDTKLRYGKILFMTDQDLDGAHIKGLSINLFHSQWHDLIKIESFLGFMNTPILKARKGKRELSFYNEQEYHKWQKTHNTKGWKVKYYKGLGTSTAKEFKEYFSKKKIVYFKYEGDSCDDILDMVFNKKRANDRKIWLGKYEKENVLDTFKQNISYQDFVNKELIHFSKYDCERSIPNAIDGLKTSQRKVLYAAFKRKLTKEIKVAQLSGYVSEHAAYHHGEASLHGTIIGMAQEFVGSNNINTFLPLGQFGTRVGGGKDSASERYIYTKLNPITACIFPIADFPVLTYISDDGTQVEPDFYVPIIPFCLVNGGKGIGTGFSTDIPCYNPIDIIKHVKAYINKPIIEKKLALYYEGFKGSIKPISDTKYIIKGLYKILNENKIHISELPIGMWIDDYKQFLETLIEKKIVKNYRCMSSTTDVDILVTFTKGTLLKLLTEKKSNNNYTCLEKKMRLYTTKTTTNMHLFDENQKMKKFKSVEKIIEQYYPIRYTLYEKRKKYMIKFLQKLVKNLHNKARFIEEQCNDLIDLRRKKKQEVTNLLKTHLYDLIDESYHYLTSMPISSVIGENIEELRKQRDEKKKELQCLQETTIKKMWIFELDQLLKQYRCYKLDRKSRQTGKRYKKKT